MVTPPTPIVFVVVLPNAVTSSSVWLSVVRYPASAWLPQSYAVFHLEIAAESIPAAGLAENTGSSSSVRYLPSKLTDNVPWSF